MTLKEKIMDNRQIIRNFWTTMGSNDFQAVAQLLLHEEYVLEWPQSGERIRGRENFAAINTCYPAEGKWTFGINELIAEGEMVVSDVTVSDGKRRDRAITFSTIRDGKIWKQVEFWPEPFAAPEWRSQWVERYK
jgi:ketosteroid isomerase-like protein